MEREISKEKKATKEQERQPKAECTSGLALYFLEQKCRTQNEMNRPYNAKHLTYLIFLLSKWYDGMVVYAYNASTSRGIGN